MPHPQLVNKTPFHFEPLYLTDEEMRPVFQGVLKATYRLVEQSDGGLVPLLEQLPLNAAGEFYGDPASSSYRYEPEILPAKMSTDVVLIANAVPPEAGAMFFDAGIKIGNLSQLARVFGERRWMMSADGMAIAQEGPASETPLIYENAFGGVDRSITLNDQHPLEARNPVGTGYHHPKGTPVVGSQLPKVENPKELIVDYYDRPFPVGFGFAHPGWEPRSQYAGTYDKTWTDKRSPLLPTDFDRRFYNGSHPNLISSQYLNGDESVVLLNCSHSQRYSFRLPCLNPPMVAVETRNRKVAKSTCNLDTIIVNTVDMYLMLFFKGVIPLKTSAHEIDRIGVAIKNVEKDNQPRLVT